LGAFAALLCLVPTMVFLGHCWRGTAILFKVPAILVTYLALQAVLLVILIWAIRYIRRD
jgi:hypothetical protein